MENPILKWIILGGKPAIFGNIHINWWFSRWISNEPSPVSRWTWELGKMGLQAMRLYFHGFWRPMKFSCSISFFQTQLSSEKLHPPKTNSKSTWTWMSCFIVVSLWDLAYFQLLLLSVSGRVLLASICDMLCSTLRLFLQELPSNQVRACHPLHWGLWVF